MCYSIRNRVEPLAQLLCDAESARAFAQTLETMSPETVAYKGLTKDHQAIVDYLMSGQVG